MPDSSLDLRPPKGMAQDLAAFLAKINFLDDVVANADSIPPGAGTGDYSKHLAKKVNKKPSDIYPIVTALLNLKFIQLETEIGESELLERLTQSLELAEPPWNEDLHRKWSESVPKIESALSKLTIDSSLMVSAKFSGLAYNRQNVLHSTKILTDVRPVFNHAASEIKGMIVTHELVVYFSSGPEKEPQELHLSLDWKDIETLREECDRANAKAQCVKQSMDGQAWRTVIYPESNEK